MVISGKSGGIESYFCESAGVTTSIAPGGATCLVQTHAHMHTHTLTLWKWNDAKWISEFWMHLSAKAVFHINGRITKCDWSPNWCKGIRSSGFGLNLCIKPSCFQVTIFIQEAAPASDPLSPAYLNAEKPRRGFNWNIHCCAPVNTVSLRTRQHNASGSLNGNKF